MILFHNHPPSSFGTAISGVALTVLGISWTLFAVQKYPLTFFVYVVFPCYFWREVLVKFSGPLLEMYLSNKLQGSARFMFRAVFVIAALQSMVVCPRAPHTPRGKNLRLTSARRLATLTAVSGASDSSHSGSYGQPGAGQNEY